MHRLLIDQAQITRTKIEDTGSATLETGQARLKLKRFALTANNVTYAAVGFAIGYWKFFPTGIDGQGLLPVWGFAEVVESRSEDLVVGTRLYGFFPLAEALVITPQAQGASVVLDAAEHRVELPGVYNRYVRVQERSAQDEGLQALLQPLLATSFLLCDWLQDNGFFEAEQVIIGSASSKTGLGLCKFLAELDSRPVKIIGLTSARNADFVAALGACDDVVTYGTLEVLPHKPSVYVDMAGNADVRQRLHTHLSDVLRHSCAVGTSHWDQFRPAQNLAGPKPQFFFAPAQIEKRRGDWGPGVVVGKIGDAWQRLASQAGSWLHLRPHEGLVQAQKVYADLAAGRANPKDGHVITL